MAAPRRRGPAGRAHFGFDEDRGVFVLYGGFDGAGNPLADTWEWTRDGGRSCVAGR